MTETEKERFKALRMDNLKAGRAWSIKETFSEFWNYSYQASAKKFFKQWYWWATHLRLKPMIDVAKMMKRLREARPISIRKWEEPSTL
jgi:transposase